MGGKATTRLSMKCKACGVIFHAIAYEVRSGKRKFCSLKCVSGGKFNGNYKGANKTNYQRKRESIARHPKKHVCRRRFEHGLKTGKIKRQPCFACGKLTVEAHHWDYTKPLDVFWLCRPHHVAAHNGRLILPLPSAPILPPGRWGVDGSKGKTTSKPLQRPKTEQASRVGKPF